MEFGLTAKIKPEVDEQQAQKEQEKIQQEFEPLEVGVEIDDSDLEEAQKLTKEEKIGFALDDLDSAIDEAAKNFAETAGEGLKSAGKFGAEVAVTKAMRKVGIPVTVPSSDLPGMFDRGGGSAGGSQSRAGASASPTTGDSTDAGASGAAGTTAGDPDEIVPLLQSQLSVQEDILAILEEEHDGPGGDSDNGGRLRGGLGGLGGGLLTGLLAGGGLLVGGIAASLNDALEDLELPDPSEIIDNVPASDILDPSNTVDVLNSVDADSILNSVDADAVLETVNADVVLDAVDADTVLDSVDSDSVLATVPAAAVLGMSAASKVLEKVNADSVLESVDADSVLDAVDADTVLNAVDADAVLDKVDSDSVIEDLPIAELVSMSPAAMIIEKSPLSDLVEDTGGGEGGGSGLLETLGLGAGAAGAAGVLAWLMNSGGSAIGGSGAAGGGMMMTPGMASEDHEWWEGTILDPNRGENLEEMGPFNGEDGRPEWAQGAEEWLWGEDATLFDVITGPRSHTNDGEQSDEDLINGEEDPPGGQKRTVEDNGPVESEGPSGDAPQGEEELYHMLLEAGYSEEDARQMSGYSGGSSGGSGGGGQTSTTSTTGDNRAADEAHPGVMRAPEVEMNISVDPGSLDELRREMQREIDDAINDLERELLRETGVR